MLEILKERYDFISKNRKFEFIILILIGLIVR